jgi:hypothetical protein
MILVVRSDLAAGRALRERLVEALEHVEWMGQPEEGDQTCAYCGSRRYRSGDGPFGKHADGCKISEALARQTQEKESQ